MPFLPPIKHMLGVGPRWLAEAALQALLPRTCVACDEEVVGEGGFCPSCWRALVPITPQLTDRQGLPLAFAGGARTGGNRGLSSQSRVRMRAAVVFNEVARRAVHKLKYHDRHEVTAPMARLMAGAGSDFLAAGDFFVPVPLHRSRLIERRFNQSALLAAPLARRHQRQMLADVLVRTRATRAQVGLSGEARARNVQGAFAVTQGARDYLAEKHIVLIDDVITTGATVRACAQALLSCGVARVDVLAFARVVPGDEEPYFLGSATREEKTGP